MTPKRERISTKGGKEINFPRLLLLLLSPVQTSNKSPENPLILIPYTRHTYEGSKRRLLTPCSIPADSKVSQTEKMLILLRFFYHYRQLE